MKIKIAGSLLVIFLICASALPAADGSLNGAYRFVSVAFPGGSQSEAQAKGMILVNGKYWANVRSTVDRKSWEENEPQDERMRKIVAAYNGLTAGCGRFEIQGNVFTMYHMAGKDPKSIGTSSKWEYKLEGNKLTLKPQAAQGVEFVFERLP